MEEFASKFMEILRQVPNITSENARVQRFQSCLPPIYKDKVELMKPKNLKEAIRKVECCYNQIKKPSQQPRSQIMEGHDEGKISRETKLI